jgi:hypothetical protein
MGRACRTFGREDSGDVLFWHVREKVILKDLGVEGRIILKVNSKCG